MAQQKRKFKLGEIVYNRKTGKRLKIIRPGRFDNFLKTYVYETKPIAEIGKGMGADSFQQSVLQRLNW